MKKIIVLPESLVGNAFKSLSSKMQSLKDYHFLLFKFSREQAEIAGVIENFNTVVELFNANHISYEFIEEDGLDEYFFYHKNDKEIYLTPTESVYQVISSAAILDYNGEIYIYGLENEPELLNYQPFVRVFKVKANSGTKVLDTTDAIFSHVIGSIATF